jgi:hypothetical protein
VGHKEAYKVVVQVRSHEVCAGCLFVRTSSVSPVGQKGERKKTEGCVAGAWIEELTPPGHPKGLPPSPVHLGGGAVVVGDSVERHVLGIGHSGLELGHDVVDPLFQEGPGGGKVGVRGRHRIDSWIVRGHFAKSDIDLKQREVVVLERGRRNRCCGFEV